MTDNDALVCELLPCPVCGDKPKWRGSRHDYAAGIYRLQCLGETHLFQAYGASEEKCIAAWNARPPLTPQAKPLDLLAQDEVEVVARSISAAHGDCFDSAFNNKREWAANRGEKGGRFRDINEPMQSDYLDMATAAIAALDRHRGTDALREENARLRGALRDASVSLWWAARQMKGNCNGSAVDAVNLAAENASSPASLTGRQG